MTDAQRRALQELLRELGETPELSPEQTAFLRRLLNEMPDAAESLPAPVWQAVRALERAAVGYSHCYERLRVLLAGGRSH